MRSCRLNSWWETLRPERSLSHNPLFQVMYNHQRGGELKGFERLGEVEIEPLEPVGVTTQFDLSLDVVEQGELSGVRVHVCGGPVRCDNDRAAGAALGAAAGATGRVALSRRAPGRVGE